MSKSKRGVSVGKSKKLGFKRPMKQSPARGKCPYCPAEERVSYGYQNKETSAYETRDVHFATHHTDSEGKVYLFDSGRKDYYKTPRSYFKVEGQQASFLRNFEESK